MNKIIPFGVAALAVAGVVGATTIGASALDTQSGNGNATRAGMQKRDGTGGGRMGGGRQASLESRAKVVGMTVDELSKALETKTMSQIAKERGMSEADFRAEMAEAAKSRWEARGLSADEIAKRFAERDARHAANAADHEWGSGEGNHMGGYGRNR